jgi:hypothetical protein
MTSVEVDEAMRHLRGLLERIHPSVLAATADELDDAGWGDTPRANIPADWRENPLPRHTGGRARKYRNEAEKRQAMREYVRRYREKNQAKINARRRKAQ